MGEYKNTLWLNIAAGTTAAIVSVLSLLLIGKTIADMF
jgi:Mn2+/Fe2+ NRAMP family transporter